MINCFFKLTAASRGFACYLHGFLVRNSAETMGIHVGIESESPFVMTVENYLRDFRFINKSKSRKII